MHHVFLAAVDDANSFVLVYIFLANFISAFLLLGCCELSISRLDLWGYGVGEVNDAPDGGVPEDNLSPSRAHPKAEPRVCRFGLYGDMEPKQVRAKKREHV